MNTVVIIISAMTGVLRQLLKHIVVQMRVCQNRHILFLCSPPDFIFPAVFRYKKSGNLSLVCNCRLASTLEKSYEGYYTKEKGLSCGLFHLSAHFLQIEGNGKEGKVHIDLVFSKMSEAFVMVVSLDLSEDRLRLNAPPSPVHPSFF